jgi:hypothetical protein
MVSYKIRFCEYGLLFFPCSVGYCCWSSAVVVLQPHNNTEKESEYVLTLEYIKLLIQSHFKYTRKYCTVLCTYFLTSALNINVSATSHLLRELQYFTPLWIMTLTLTHNETNLNTNYHPHWWMCEVWKVWKKYDNMLSW